MAKSKTRPKYKSRASKKLRVAFIGAGGRALMAHYPSLRDIPEAELVAVAELDEQRLHKTCDLYDIKGRYSDYRQMLEREKTRRGLRHHAAAPPFRHLRHRDRTRLPSHHRKTPRCYH